MPAWGALLIALTGIFVGVAIESGYGHRELGAIFAACFAAGCVAAVLAVRQSGLFTAMVQPPLLLFVAVPSAYYLFQSGSFNGLKDGLITCLYPLIERFPLMLFTTLAVLLLGLVRRYLATFQSSAYPDVPETQERPTARSGLAARIASAFAGMGGTTERDEATGRPARPRHGGRPTRAKRPRARTSGQEGVVRNERPASIRHSRPLHEDELPPRDRRETNRHQQTRRSRRDGDAPRSEPPRRRSRPSHDTGSRNAPPPPARRESRHWEPGYGPRDVPREPWDGRDTPRQPRPPRPGRFDQPPYAPRPDLPPYPGYGPPPGRRPGEAPRGPQGDPRAADTHHPVSRVRYRRTEPDYRDDARS